MTTGRPGAAHIALPFDVQNGSVDANRAVCGDASLGVSGAASRARANSVEVARAAKLLGASGASGFHLRRRRRDLGAPNPNCFELAERLSAPVATTISGKGSIGEQHPLAAGVVGSNGGTPETRAIVDQADLIFSSAAAPAR